MASTPVDAGLRPVRFSHRKIVGIASQTLHYHAETIDAVPGRTSMTTAEDYASTEVRFWQLVHRATFMLGGDQNDAWELRYRLDALPWERRCFLYNASPLDVAADLSGIVPTKEQRDEYGRLEHEVLDFIDEHLSTPLETPMATPHRYRIDVDRLAATG
jgi:hypothetical protein